MNFSQNYLEHLLNSIENKRALSLQEFYKTDLNDKETIEDMNLWYDQIILKVKNKVPAYYVKCIEIVENEAAQIKMINYIYFNHDEELHDVSFVRELKEK